MPSGEVDRLRPILDELSAYLDRQYANLYLLYEADMQALIYRFLRDHPLLQDGDYLVGCCHQVYKKKWKPDITLYRIEPDKFKGFLEDKEEFVVALIEMKYRSGLKDDLTKLTKMQKYFEKSLGRDILAWMVYGDHGNEAVHKSNYRTHVRRGDAIKEWAKEQPKTRGYTLLALGHTAKDDTAQEKKVRELFNEVWWHRDDKIVG